MNSREATMFRAAVARGNYLAQDRSDIQYAVKELSRGMSNPTQNDDKQLKRLARYLIGRERAVTEYGYQGNYRSIEVWSDTDYAGCKRTRKSSTGGVVKLGNHVIKTWSNTQSIIALSSGEAEFYGMVKAGSVGFSGLNGVLSK